MPITDVIFIVMILLGFNESGSTLRALLCLELRRVLRTDQPRSEPERPDRA